MSSSIAAIREAIMVDPANRDFTSRGWKPLFMADSRAKILIIGQAPGAKTQAADGVFHDQSGIRLRKWLGVDADTFYNQGLIAVLPMDFFFPGHNKQGDKPPRPNFYKKWHPKLLALMPEIELTILIGKYAQQAYLDGGYPTITANVNNYQTFLPRYFPLIHPSPRNHVWIARHPEFESEILPALRNRVHTILTP